jgi:8-oxo-dGTP pyrophosphatase MutT (NUDIX family)
MNKPNQAYATGILIDWSLESMLLCQKFGTKPLEFANKWNAIGGKIEKGYVEMLDGTKHPLPYRETLLGNTESKVKGQRDDETPHEAMVREFKEETGMHISMSRWTCFFIKQYRNGNKCYFFVAFGDEPKHFNMSPLDSPGKENLLIGRHSLIDILFAPENYQYDLLYIISMLVTESRRGTIKGLDPEGINTSAR